MNEKEKVLGAYFEKMRKLDAELDAAEAKEAEEKPKKKAKAK